MSFNVDLSENSYRVNFSSQFRSVPDRYVEKLIDANVLTRESARDTVDGYTAWLNRILKEPAEDVPLQPEYFAGRWTGIKQAETNVTQWNTGVELGLLEFVGKKSVEVPADLVRRDAYSRSILRDRSREIKSTLTRCIKGHLSASVEESRSKSAEEDRERQRFGLVDRRSVGHRLLVASRLQRENKRTGRGTWHFCTQARDNR